MKALQVFGAHGISQDIYEMLLEDAGKAGFSLKIRIYYALAQYMKENRITFGQTGYDALEAMCFGTIQRTIYDNAAAKLPSSQDYRIAKNEVTVELPVRVNWGGWTDTSSLQRMRRCYR